MKASTYFTGLGKSSLFFFSILLLGALVIGLLDPWEAESGQATVSWIPPTTYTDGTPLASLGGYKLYYGTVSGSYSQVINVGNVTVDTVTNLTDGLTYYFAATAYDTNGVESILSAEVSKTIPLPVQQYSLTVSKGGTGSGTVSSSPAGINCGTSCAASYNAGTVVTLTATPASGSTFSGWSGGGCVGNGICSITLNASTTVSATFSANPVNGVCGSSNGGTFTAAPTTNLCSSGTATAATGAGPWTWSCTGLNGGATASCSANIQTWTVTATAGTGGTVSPASQTVNNNAKAMVTVTPNSGYTASVGGTCGGTFSGNTYTTNAVTSSCSVSATFSANPVNGVCGSSNGGTFTAAPTTNLCSSGTATAVTGTGPWTWSCTGLNGGTTAACSANIQTVNQYTITASAGAGGSISPSGTVTVTQGSYQTFTITPASGYMIADVKVDGKTLGAVTSYGFSNVTANHSISATFFASNAVTEEWGNAPTSNHLGTIEDTFINIDNINYATNTQLHTYTWPAGSVSNAIVMKWDISSIPSGSSIVSATLSLYMEGYEGTGGNALYTVSAHKLINKNPVISQATGYNASASTAWSPATGVYNNIPLAQGDIAPPEDARAVDASLGYKSWTVTKMVQDWVNNSGTNYGMLLNSDASAVIDSNRIFSSSENQNMAQRPKLVITYIPPVVPAYTISATAGAGGSISPSGTVTVTQGGNQTFTITPASGYKIADVKVDGISVGAVASYSFSNVTSNHTISATFAANTTAYTIRATAAGTGGSISPSGTVTVSQGSNKTFMITPKNRFRVADVKVDGVSVGATTSFTFTNVSANHTINVSFTKR